MGRENYLKIVKKGGKTFIGLGIFVSIISIFMLLIFLVTDETIQVAPIIAFSIMLGLGIVLFVLGADYKKGENSRYIKKHPYVLELVNSFSLNTLILLLFLIKQFLIRKILETL